MVHRREFGVLRRMPLSARARLILALILLIAQAAIVALALFAPRVSTAYRAYFLDHTAAEWHGEGG